MPAEVVHLHGSLADPPPELRCVPRLRVSAPAGKRSAGRHSADRGFAAARIALSLLLEAALKAQPDLPVTILRYPAVYGPNDMHRFGPWLKQMAAGAPGIRLQEGFAAWRWTHGFAEDVAESVALAVTNQRAAGRTYNVGEPQTPPSVERLASLARVIGWHGRIVPVPAAELPQDQRMPHDFPHHLVVDSTPIPGCVFVWIGSDVQRCSWFNDVCELAKFRTGEVKPTALPSILVTQDAYCLLEDCF